jgi:outer membrane protein assembly factor BamB
MSFLLALFVTFAPADWPKFRGPTADGHVPEQSVPIKWSETENVKWKVSIPGLGWSSPTVVSGRIYLTTATVPEGGGLSLRALSLDAANGQILWDREVRAIPETPSIHTKNSHASPTPIVDNGSVYVHFGALGTAKLRADTGELVWLNTELQYPPLHGSGGSPVLHNGRLAVVCDGSVDPFVAAVDAETGKVLWKQPRSVKTRISHSFATAAIAETDGKSLVMAPGPDHFAAYDLQTGEEVWKVLAPGWSVVPQPIVAHGLVIYNHDYDNPELMAVRLGGTGDVTESHVAWRRKRGAPSTPSPLLVGEDLYCVSDDGIATCVHARSGEQHWMERLGGNFSASPIYAGGRVLFLDETGRATWIEAAREFREVQTNSIPGRTLATPAFADGAMFLRTDEHLYRIEETTAAR